MPAIQLPADVVANNLLACAAGRCWLSACHADGRGGLGGGRICGLELCLARRSGKTGSITGRRQQNAEDEHLM